MSANLPHAYEMSPRYRVLDSAVRGSHGGGVEGWQLHLIKQPSWNYGFVWLCPLDRNGDAGFILHDSRFPQTRMFSAQEKLSDLEANFKNTLKNDHLVRRFVLNTRGELRQGNQRAHDVLTVRRDGVAAWEKRETTDGTRFLWRKLRAPMRSRKWIELPASQIWAELQTLLANPNSEANFARQFMRLNSVERRERVQRTQRGTLDELNLLLRDVLLASPQWDDLQRDLYLSIGSDGQARMWEIGRPAPDEIEVPVWVRDHVRALWEGFEPFAQNIAKFLCVLDSNENSLYARASRPSAHDRLEAQLRLRDWMNAHP